MATDMETGISYQLKAKVVINATGVFVDDLLQMDKPGTGPLVRPSQGVHLVVDSSFMPSADALMIPKRRTAGYFLWCPGMISWCWVPPIRL